MKTEAEMGGMQPQAQEWGVGVASNPQKLEEVGEVVPCRLQRARPAGP